MTPDRQGRYARLLRWYPRWWRDENSEVMLDSLEQHASDRGIAGPSGAESWSHRAHGLGERLTPSWAVAFAATALAAFLVATGLQLTGGTTFSGASAIQLLCSVFVGPLSVALAAVVLLHQTGWLSAPGALFTAICALPAFGFTALMAASWSVGFAEAATGAGHSWFGAATGYFFILAWIAGTVSLLAPAGSLLRSRPSSRHIRVAQSALLTAPTALIFGAVALTAQTIGTLVAVVVLFVALGTNSSSPATTPHDTAGFGVQPLTPPLTPRPTPAAPAMRRQNTAIGSAALVSLIVGLGCVIFALIGSSWSAQTTDATSAMNLGLAAGAIAAVPATIAAGVALTPRFGQVMAWSVLTCCAALVLASTAQVFGAGHPAQWPLMLAAAVLMGFGLSMPFGRLVPGGRLLRIGVIVAVGLASSSLGLAVVTMSAFIAPLGAAALVVWALKRASGSGRQRGPQLIQP